MSNHTRQERAVRRHLRELERMEKEQAKYDERAKAKLEVDRYESQIELLLSLHKEVGEAWNWAAIAASLAPLPPLPAADFEMKARQSFLILIDDDKPDLETILESARRKDCVVTTAEKRSYEQRVRDWAKMTNLARRIISNDTSAYQEAIQELSPLAELSELGSNMEFTVHSRSFIECELTMKDSAVIPAETKSLTSTGKLSVKAMPRGRFHEIYQDYICGGVLRVVRELFALLPVESVLVTATTSVFDTATGITADKPVLSVMVQRSEIAHLKWEHLDPSDAIERLTHRGDFKASRKTGAFLPITPLRSDTIDLETSADSALPTLLNRARALRTELGAELTGLVQQ